MPRKTRTPNYIITSPSNEIGFQIMNRYCKIKLHYDADRIRFGFGIYFFNLVKTPYVSNERNTQLYQYQQLPIFFIQPKLSQLWVKASHSPSRFPYLQTHQHVPMLMCLKILSFDITNLQYSERSNKKDCLGR